MTEGSRSPGRLASGGPERILLYLAPLLYAAYALVVPPFQTPDEHQHLFRAWQVASFDLVGERRGDEAGGMLPPSLGQAAAAEIGSIYPHAAREIPVRPAYEMYSRRTAVDTGTPERFTNFFGSVIYPPTSYVPQVVAIWLGRSVGFSVESILRLARLLNSALTITLLWGAIRITPLGKRLLLTFALLPPVAAFSASMGQDGLVIGLSALVVATGLRAVVSKGWDWSSVMVLALATPVMTLAKIVYLPLAALALMPTKLRGQRVRMLLPPLAAIVCAGICLAGWQSLIAPSLVKFGPAVADSSAQVRLILSDPGGHLGRVTNAYGDQWLLLLISMFCFGWLNVGPAIGAAILSVLALAIVIYDGDENAGQLPISTRCWMIILVAIALTLLATALFIYFNLPNTDRITGLQGRYLLPLVPALLIPLLRTSKSSGNNLVPALGLTLGANLSALIVIFMTFYRL